MLHLHAICTLQAEELRVFKGNGQDFTSDVDEIAAFFAFFGPSYGYLVGAQTEGVANAKKTVLSNALQNRDECSFAGRLVTIKNWGVAHVLQVSQTQMGICRPAVGCCL